LNPRTPKDNPNSTSQTTQATMDWDDFQKWLESKYVHDYVTTILLLSRKYFPALFDAKQAAQFHSLSLTMRKTAMKSVTALSKYLGLYSDWQKVMQQADLKWEKEPAASVFKSIISQEGYKAFEWLTRSLPKLPDYYRLPLVYIALSGLRPSEACQSHKIIYELHSKGKLFGDFDKDDGYYDKALSLLAHYKFQDVFFRNTKNAYITFIPSEMLELLCKTKPYAYPTLETKFGDYDCRPVQTSNLRAHYATILKKDLDRELIDLIQGRIDPSVFVKHYYRPLLIELRDKVLTAIKPLEEELLAFLD